MGIEQSISRIINQGENLLAGGGSPQVGFQASPDMIKIAQQNPALAGMDFTGATVASAMPGAPNTNRLAQMANPRAAGSNMSMLGPVLGTGLGLMSGGPRGALAGGMMGALGASDNPGLAAMAPMALQAMGMGQQQQLPPVPMQRPMSPPQQPGMGMPQPLPPIAGHRPQMPPQVAQMLGLG